jgi:hypothetical protein
VTTVGFGFLVRHNGVSKFRSPHVARGKNIMGDEVVGPDLDATIDRRDYGLSCRRRCRTAAMCWPGTSRSRRILELGPA